MPGTQAMGTAPDYVKSGRGVVYSRLVNCQEGLTIRKPLTPIGNWCITAHIVSEIQERYVPMQLSSEEDKSALVGLWVLLVDNEGQLPNSGAERVPMMARAGNDQTYLLGFKNMSNARRFIQKSQLEAAEPRMVVKGNKSHFLQIARDAGVVGILVDYDPTTQQYATATELY